MRTTVVVVLIGCVACSSCGDAPRADSPGATPIGARDTASTTSAEASSTQAAVPAETLDSMPSWIWDDSLFVLDASGDALSTTVLTVYFELGATEAERQAAIELVDGTVVGGLVAGGIYYVQIEGDGTLAGIERIAARLRALPEVWHASPFGLARIVPNRSR